MAVAKLVTFDLTNSIPLDNIYCCRKNARMATLQKIKNIYKDAVITLIGDPFEELSRQGNYNHYKMNEFQSLSKFIKDRL